MTTKEILAEMAKGAILCCGYEGDDKVFWLEPRRVLIRRDQAENIIGLPGLKPNKDGMFDDAYSQTWRVA